MAETNNAGFSVEQRIEAASCLDLLNYERQDKGLLTVFCDIALKGLVDYAVEQHRNSPELISNRIENFCYGRDYRGYPPGGHSDGYVQRLERFQDMPAAGHIISDVDVKNHRKFADDLVEYKTLLENNESTDIVVGKASAIAVSLFPGADESSSEPRWLPGEVLRSIQKGGVYLAKVARRD